MASNLVTAGMGRTPTGGFLAAAGMGRQLAVDVAAEIRGSVWHIEGIPTVVFPPPPITGAMRITLGIRVTGEGEATNAEEALRLVINAIGEGTVETELTIDVGARARTTDLEIYSQRNVRLGVADETTIDEHTRRLHEDDDDIVLLLEDPAGRTPPGKEKT